MPGSNHRATEMSLSKDGTSLFVSIATHVFHVNARTMAGNDLGAVGQSEIFNLVAGHDNSYVWIGDATGIRQIPIDSNQPRLGPIEDASGQSLSGAFCFSETPDGSRLFACDFNSLNVVRPARLPSAPSSLTVTRQGKAALASWRPPSDDGGLPGSAVRVTATPSGASCVSQTNSCRIKGLQGGRSYTFTAESFNALGTGASVTTSRTYRFVTTPSAPRSVKASPQGRNARVAWKKPARSGGSNIMGYKVVAVPGGKSCDTSGTKSCVIEGLAPGINYRFSVSAVNKIGPGTSSLSGSITIPIPFVPPPPPKPKQILS